MIYKFGKLSFDAVLCFLQETDTVFQTPLSQKVNLSEYARKLSDYSMFSYCEIEGRIVGMISCYVNRPPVSYISNVCVRGEYQHRGVFSGMFRLLIAELKQRGIKTVRLEVNDQNENAQEVYRHFDFVPVDRAGENSVFFERFV